MRITTRKRWHPVWGLLLALGLGMGLSLVVLRLPRMVGASGPEGVSVPEGTTDPDRPTVGLASDELACMAVGGEQTGRSSGVVRLTWPGTADRARLILSVSGTEAAHTILVNGQPAAQVPIHPFGQTCRDGETFYLDIPTHVLVQGANTIEITRDALPGDSWSASHVRLEVLGRFAIPTPGDVGINDRIAATAVTSYTATFQNPYDGTTQEARVVIPTSYDGTAPVPLVIYVHGRSSDMYEGEQAFAEAIDEKGWLLATPQLHGSWTGDPQPDPPGKYAYASLESQYDIIGITSYMLAQYGVITDQIYLIGNSMGGQIATVVAPKYPHVFAAVYDNKGPTDMVQWYYENTNYHQQFMRRECHIGEVEQDPTQNPFCYQRRSGINYAGNYVHIPISVAHSVSDTLVPIHHSRDLRDAINADDPDRLVVIYEDTIVGPTCGEPYHCYYPDRMDVLSFLEQFTLYNEPAHIKVMTDEPKSTYWLNVAQTGGDHWSYVEAGYDLAGATATATISDTRPLALAFNLGTVPITGVAGLASPGMGLPATTYLLRGGGNNGLRNYASGYLTTTLGATGQFTVTISAITVSVTAVPGTAPGASIITALSRDHLYNPVPDGTTVVFTTTAGLFANGDTTTVGTTTGGQATTILTIGQGSPAVHVFASVERVTGSTWVDHRVYLPLIAGAGARAGIRQ